MAALKKLCFGTASLGIEGYGISPQEFIEKPIEFINFLHSEGIRNFDTAKIYGNSEYFLGQAHSRYNWNISDVCIDTKIDGLVPESSSNSKIIRSLVLDSLRKLNIDHINVLYLHQNEKAIISDKKIISELLKLKQSGYIKYIGASIYEENELEMVAETNIYDWVQIPGNIFDCSLINFAGKCDQLRIAVRSVFLQGALFCNNEMLLSLPNGSELVKLRDIYQKICSDNAVTLESLAIEYLQKKPRVEKIILGTRNRLIWSNILNNQWDMPKDIFSKLDALASDKKLWTNPRGW